MGCLPNDRLIAMGGVDFRLSEDAGSIWMLAVHERFQSLGAGAELIAALEHKIIDHGRGLARMLVEHDNPELGHFTNGWAIRRRTTLDSWPVAGGKTYVTACTIMETQAGRLPRPGGGGGLELPAMSLSFTFAVLLICGVFAAMVGPSACC